MPYGYLASAALVAWCTLFAVAPRRRPRVLGRVTFWSGLLVNEIPHTAFFALLASTVLAGAQGDLGSPGGQAVLGLAAVTTAGLAVTGRRALRAGPAVDRAMTDALGEGWRGDVAARPRLRLARIVLAPWYVRRRDVERVANIRYGDAGERNLLDVYRRRTGPSDGPTLVYVHGGEYRSGRKNREARPLLYRLASRGWVCVSANYRLNPEVEFPDHLIDLKKVIAWVREHGPGHGADPRTVFVAGSSAGGHMAALAALTPGDPVFQPGFEHADTSVAAAICLYGYYGPVRHAAGLPSSPSDHVRPDAPPLFMAHGDRDPFVLVEDAREFAGRLRSVSSSPVVYAELPWAQHAFDLFHSVRFDTVVTAIEAFTARVRSGDEFRAPDRSTG